MVKIKDMSHALTDARGRSAWVFSNVSFDIQPREFLSLVGPSGCGKSTLLRVISGLLKPSEGTIERGFQKQAMVFQNFALFPWLSVLENVEFGLKMEGFDAHKCRHVAEEKIVEVGLAGFEKKYPKELSGGQRQRVGIARALTVNPDLLLMDEPFSSLDSVIADKLKRDVHVLWEKYKMTVLMVNHLIADAIELSDRIIVMGGSPGSIKAVIPVTLSRPRNNRSPEFFELQDRITRLIEE